MSFLSAVILTVLSSFALASDADFKIEKSYEVNFENVYGGQQKPTFGLELSVVILKDTGWTEQAVASRLRGLAEVYKDCDIKIVKAKVIVVQVPSDLRNVAWSEANGSVLRDDVSLVKLVKNYVSAPTLFYYAQSELSGMANAFAYSQQFRRYLPTLVDTSWYSIKLTSPEVISLYVPNFSVEAHELGHILLKADHNKESNHNFMAGYPSLLNNSIETHQCRKMQVHSLVYRL